MSNHPHENTPELPEKAPDQKEALVTGVVEAIRTDTDYESARNGLDMCVHLAKEFGDNIEAIFYEFKLRQLEIRDMEAANAGGRPMDAERIAATADAIASLKDMMEKEDTSNSERLAAIVPDMIMELTHAKTLLCDHEHATQFVEELKQSERVAKSLAEPGETIWKEIIADLEQEIERIRWLKLKLKENYEKK